MSAVIAAASAVAFAIAGGVVRPELSVGVAAVALAVLVGGFWLDMPASAVLALFPSDLFLVLFGVTLLFAAAGCNGTLDKLAARAVRSCGREAALFPLALYAFVSLLTMAGPGNIAAIALAAPAAMAMGARLGLGAFLMTLLLVGAANGAAFSPFTPTGILSNGLVARMAGELGLRDLSALGWKIHLNALVAQGAVNVGGFLLLGGWAWMRRQRRLGTGLDGAVPEPAPFDGRQRATLAAMAALVASGVAFGFPALRGLLPAGAANAFSNVGATALMLATGLFLLRAADPRAAFARVPWDALLMVCGITVLVGVFQKAGGAGAMTSALGASAGPREAVFRLALTAGLLSVYSSSSGVVMPLLLPMVPGLAARTGADPEALISAVNVGSHLVDTSPLSTLGALCLACAAAREDRERLFRRAMAWSLSMALVGAAACWFFFGILGI